MKCPDQPDAHVVVNCDIIITDNEENQVRKPLTEIRTLNGTQ